MIRDILIFFINLSKSLFSVFFVSLLRSCQSLILAAKRIASSRSGLDTDDSSYNREHLLRILTTGGWRLRDDRIKSIAGRSSTTQDHQSNGYENHSIIIKTGSRQCLRKALLTLPPMCGWWWERTSVVFCRIFTVDRAPLGRERFTKSKSRLDKSRVKSVVKAKRCESVVKSEIVKRR